jgi:hypothetical protein
MIQEYEVETNWSRARGARIEGRFLKGPIPFTHLASAARLPGHALTVLLAIYHQTALTRKDWVTLPKGLMSDLGVSRDCKARALHALQEAFLVSVERCKGKTARVMLRPSASRVACNDTAFATSAVAVSGDNLSACRRMMCRSGKIR